MMHVNTNPSKNTDESNGMSLSEMSDEQIFDMLVGKETMRKALFWCDSEAEDRQYNHTQLCDEIDISLGSLRRIIPQLIAIGVFERVSDEGSQIHLYEVNRTSPVLTEMHQFIRVAAGDY